MLAAGILALALAANVALHVEEAGELERAETQQIAEQLARAVEARTSSVARVEDPAWWGCAEDSEDRCVGEIRARTGSADVVLLRLFAGASAVRVIADRHSERRTPLSATIDLARTSTVWSRTIGELASALFPEARGRPLALAIAPRLPDHDQSSSVLPYLLIGVGVASAGLSTGLWISSRNASAELESGIHSHTESESLRGRMRTHGLASGGFMIGAGVAVLAGVILSLIAEPSVDLPPQRFDAQQSASAF